MRAYVIRRLLILIPILLLVSMVVFLMTYLMPGDMIDAMQALSQDVAPERTALEASLGLDRPIYIQYGRWLGVIRDVDGSFSGVLQGNLGTSYWKMEPVLKLVAKAWPVTLELGIIALVIAQLIALPIGIYSAVRQDTWGDYIGRTFAIGCISIPNFWLGVLILLFPALWWGYMPSLLLIPFTEDPIGNLQMFIVPGILLGVSGSGLTMRITRTMMLEVLRQDYIRTAWAKGLKERVVILRHALRNALIPVVSQIGLSIPVLVGGAVIIEQIFVLPGMGRLLIYAVLQRDDQLVLGITFIFAVVLMLINLMVDISYAFLDPRVRYK